MEDFKGKYAKQFNYILMKYEFRFNVVISLYEYRKVEYKKQGRTNLRINHPWLKYDDRVKSNILIELTEKDLDIAEGKFNMFIESEIVSPDYNPFVEYFENLEEWDQKTDYIKQLSQTVKTPDKEHFESTLLRFFVGSLECLLDEDSVNDVCLVFQSGQGVGKSRWMRSLLPKRFQAEYLYEGNIDTKNKDHTLYLSQYWFIHLDELEAFRNNDISAIKSYITRQRISERKSYGRYKSKYTRRASFLGSVNDDKFLTDITGNRRWLVFKVNEIQYDHDVNVDRLWAQVYHLWKNGFKHWFDVNEIKVINQINEEFRSMSADEEMLLHYYKFPEPESQTGEYVSSIEILQQIAHETPSMVNKFNARNIGKALSKHSKAKKRNNGINKYYVVWNGLDTKRDTNPEERDRLSLKDLGEGSFEEKEIKDNFDPDETFTAEDYDDMPF